MSENARFDEEQTTEKRARILGLPYADTSKITDKVLYKDLLSVQELNDFKVIPIEKGKGYIHFGIINTTSQNNITSLKQRFLDHRLSFSLISEAGFREYMQLYDPPKKVEYQDIEISNAGSKDLVAHVSQTLEQVKASDMLAYLVQQAHKLNASDIHIENQREKVRIRLRIDGVLHPIAEITHEKNRILRSAIASAGNISTSANTAQQGHISQRLQMANEQVIDINLRLETVPTIHGMDVVMRLFNMNPDMYQLDRLGLSEKHRKVVDDIVAKPTGLVMAVGPTGSGKTTTLYSILNTLNNDERKIITIEDPVEYQFNGVTQVSVNSKNSDETNFADNLRAVLRLDPDIVLVGEIRDMDTAKTALQASLTGHLVLSTFHASSAAAALTRLMDIIGENPLFVSAIRLVMAQRLVRRLDEQTKQEYEPSETELNYIRKILETFPQDSEKPNIEGLKLFKPGSSAENPYGYKGQIAIREQFMMSGKIMTLLQGGNTSTSTDEIEQAAIASGMQTMLHDGIQRVIAGETSLQELTRVVG